MVEIRQEAVEAISTKAWTKANSIIVFEATIAEVVVEVEVNEPIFPQKPELEQLQRNLLMIDFNGNTMETFGWCMIVGWWIIFNCSKPSAPVLETNNNEVENIGNAMENVQISKKGTPSKTFDLDSCICLRPLKYVICRMW